jgi:hypothetical protein
MMRASSPPAESHAADLRARVAELEQELHHARAERDSLERQLGATRVLAAMRGARDLEPDEWPHATPHARDKSTHSSHVFSIAILALLVGTALGALVTHDRTAESSANEHAQAPAHRD